MVARAAAKRPPLDPQRVEAFALAYAPAVLDVVRRLGPWHGEQKPEAYATELTLAMVAGIERAGVEAVQHYYLNGAGALRTTCDALGVQVEALDIYLRGGTLPAPGGQ